ncbi:tubulin monoglycylase TTLL3-like [Megalops cyprinoides]|uniref:tubulin monoglycylase TTLL3-like n=1 Tax=Megalops cyprinoides TaxID=118141 RepID=UPI0018641648|nr:tubulin monoglycylase TTLL3-like [Megalops cyprinoides]XP_036389173.1 tubulin monoglycylase TTLL3-like [Megalops cyprinoides]
MLSKSVQEEGREKNQGNEISLLRTYNAIIADLCSEILPQAPLQKDGDPLRDGMSPPQPSQRAQATPPRPSPEKSAQQPQSPMEPKVRRSLTTVPVISPERMRMAKALVDKAVRQRKVFSVQGPYPVVRAALRARGWVEHRLPRPARTAGRRLGDEGEDKDDSNDDEDSSEEGEKEEDPDELYDLMCRLVRNEAVYFYWTMRRDAIDYRMLRKEQMVNHYAKAGTFTTKVGLCVNLRNLKWFDSADPDTFFPRCYRLGAVDEKHAFIEDFRRTACTSLLQCVVERSRGEKREESRAGRSPNTVNVKGQKQCKRPAMQTVGSGIIGTALRVCQDFLDSIEHHDIDISMETPPSLTEQEWAEFLHNYYLVVHDGVEIQDSAQHVDSCQTMLQKTREVSPQLDTDGIHNIWIVKPGAMSRGRGIICMKHLDAILKLVDCDPGLIKDSKWVVQKYLERPLLIHGTKFDLRQWFLVTDWNPLTVWFYRECYLRFSTQPYSVETLDSSVHLCNNSIQKHFQPSQLRHPEVPEDNMWSCWQFCDFLRGQGKAALWDSVVVPGMQQAVVHALQTAQDLVESRRGSFELYGADFMLGGDLRPWLIEINASPTMAPSTAVTARLCAAVQEDTLRVVLDRRLHRSAHTGGFKLIYRQAAVDIPQYVGVSLLVEGSSVKRPRRRAKRKSHPPKLSPVVQPLADESAQEEAGSAGKAVGKARKTVKPARPSPVVKAHVVPSRWPQEEGTEKETAPRAETEAEAEVEGKEQEPEPVQPPERERQAPRQVPVPRITVMPDAPAFSMEPKKSRHQGAGLTWDDTPPASTRTLSRSMDSSRRGSAHSRQSSRPGSSRSPRPGLTPTPQGSRGRDSPALLSPALNGSQAPPTSQSSPEQPFFPHFHRQIVPVCRGAGARQSV